MADQNHEENKPAEGEDEPLIAETDRVNVGMIALVTLAIVSMTVAVVIGVQQFFNETIRGEQAKKQLSYDDPRLKEMGPFEIARLSKYQWVSQKDGIVRIPKDRARELVLAEYGKLPPYVPGSAAPPAPAPAPAPETSASAAASGSASAAPSSSAPPAGSTSAAPPASASAAPHGSASAHH